MEAKHIRIDDILGTAEVAEVLNVSKQRIRVIRQMKDFPEPIKNLASTPLWDRAEVLEFLKVWRPWMVLDNE